MGRSGVGTPVILQSCTARYPVGMNNRATARAEASVLRHTDPAEGSYDALCRQVRALAGDADLTALARRPRAGVNDALRHVLDAHPHLGALPFEVLAHEVALVMDAVRPRLAG